MRIVGAFHPPEPIRAILECLGLPSRAPSIAAEWRSRQNTGAGVSLGRWLGGSLPLAVESERAAKAEVCTLPLASGVQVYDRRIETCGTGWSSRHKAWISEARSTNTAETTKNFTEVP